MAQFLLWLSLLLTFGQLLRSSTLAFKIETPPNKLEAWMKRAGLGKQLDDSDSFTTDEDWAENLIRQRMGLAKNSHKKLTRLVNILKELSEDSRVRESLRKFLDPEPIDRYLSSSESWDESAESSGLKHQQRKQLALDLFDTGFDELAEKRNSKTEGSKNKVMDPTYYMMGIGKRK